MISKDLRQYDKPEPIAFEEQQENKEQLKWRSKQLSKIKRL